MQTEKWIHSPTCPIIFVDAFLNGKVFMHYYQFNIGDYRKDTSHLTPIEHYIYRTLIDWYYLDEKPIPKETQVVLRRLMLGLENELNLLNVLKDFFQEGKESWFHNRIEDEIKSYQRNVQINRINGKLGGRPKKTQSVNSANRNESETNPNYKLETINHKPKTNKYIPPLSPVLLSEWLITRKNKPVTELAFKAVEREAKLAGISVEEAITICCERGWISFKADWINKPQSKSFKEDTMAAARSIFTNSSGIPYYQAKEIEIKNDE